MSAKEDVLQLADQAGFRIERSEKREIMINLDILKPHPQDVKIGRLLKKIERLQNQLKFCKERLSHYEKIVTLHPWMRYSYNVYKEQLAIKEENESNKNRVKEQEQLIQRLLKEAGNHE